jgi:hypothetical protein
MPLRCNSSGPAPEAEPVSPWLKRAWLLLVSLCVAYVAGGAYERWTEHRAEQLLEAEREHPTDTSQMSEEAAQQHHDRLVTARMRTALGKQLQQDCNEQFAAYESRATPENQAAMERHCMRHQQYLTTGEDPGLPNQ